MDTYGILGYPISKQTHMTHRGWSISTQAADPSFFRKKRNDAFRGPLQDVQSGAPRWWNAKAGWF